MDNHLKTELYQLIKNDERIFNFIQDNASDGLWFWDLKNPENKWFSNSFWEILGYKPSEISNNLTEWQKLEQSESSLKSIKTKLSDPNFSYNQEIQYTHKNGSIIWMHSSGFTINNDNGKPNRMFGTLKRITKLKEEKFKYFFQESPISILLFQNNGQLVNVNKQTLDLFGINTKDSILNYNLWESFNLTKENIKQLKANKSITISTIFDFENTKKHNNLNSIHQDIKYLKAHISPIKVEDCLNGYLVHIIDNTQQVKTKKNIQNQIDLFETIINSVPSRIFWKDLNSNYLGCNIHFAKEANLENGIDIIGQSDFDMVWKEHAEMYRKDDQNVIQTGIPKHNYNEPFIDKNGNQLIWNTSKIPLKSNSGEIFGLVGVSENITEQVLADRKIKESEHKFRSIFEHVNVGIAIFNNKDRAILEINQGYLNITGYTKEEFLQLNYTDVIHPEDLKKEELLVQKVYENKSNVYRLEKRLKGKDGNYIWLDSNVTSIRKSNNEIEKFIVLVIDITEKKKATETMNMFFEQPMNLHAIATLNGVLLKINKGWYNMLGYKKEELEGTNCLNITHPNDLENTLAEMKKLEQGKKVYYFVNRYQHKDGHYITLAWSAVANENLIHATAKNITEEKAYQEALLKSEENYKALSENANHIIIVHNFDGEITYINKYALDFLGITKEKAIGLDITTFITDSKDRKDYHDRKNKFISGQIETSNFELPVKLPNGQKYFLDVIGSPIIINSKAESILISAYDITYRKESELQIKYQNEEFEALNEELRQTNEELFTSIQKEETINERFNLAMQATSDGLWDWDLITNNVYFSPTYKRMLGYRDSELENSLSNWEKLTAANDVKRTFDLLEKLMENKDSRFDIDFKMRHKNGHWISISSRAKIFFNKEQKPIRIVGTHTDITLKKLAETKLIESEEKLRSAIENSPLGVSMNDINGQYISTNQAFRDMIGYTNDELKQLTFFDITHPDYLEKNSILHNELISSNKKEFKIEKVYLKKNGDPIPVRIHVTTIVNHKATPLFMAFIEDISEVKKTLEDLKIAKEKAEESNLLKTEFLHNMSHEIRTPMNGIMGFSALLYDIEGLDEEQINYISIIQNSSKQLLQIIDDILEISTLETKQLSIQESEFNVNNFIMELFAIYDLKSKERNVPLYIKKQLKNEDSLIISDKTKLHKILTNLLDNSFKFTNSGKIEFGYKIENSNIIFYVTDTGIGISRDKRAKIFERFSQENSETALTFGGLGLGLSIAKENTELLKGKIMVKSTKGEGSTFYVEIPHKYPKNINLTKALANETPEDIDVFHILIAEDEEVNYLYLEAILGKTDMHKIKLQHVIDGKEAVEKCLNDDSINLVLMDIKMPIMNGYLATEKIKSFKPYLPIIAQTAYSTESEKEMAIQSGCDDFISKPIEKNKLLQLISKYMNKQ
jgi:PAS domain S-box-containing protein